MGKIIGIDLGTTNSVVAIMEGDQPKVLINSQGSRLTPSVVAFTEKGEILVGQTAKHQQVTNPKNTVFSIKRFMGRRHSEVGQEEKMVPYEIIGGAEEMVKVKVRGKEYTPEQISAMILQDLKKTAETYLGEKVTDAVITVPAYFNDAQRKATKDAGEIAGLKVLRVLPEPTAAALAYGLDKKKNEKICVFDLGGGTFDVSVLDVGDGVFEVLSINGNTHLGGDDFDEVLINYLAEEFRKQEGIDLRKDAMALQRLKEAAEKAKIELSTAMETTVNLPFITADQNGPEAPADDASRGRSSSSSSTTLVEKCRQPVIDALQDAKLQPEPDRRSGAGRRLDPRADGQAAGEGAVPGQGAQPDGQPGRSGGGRRGHPGRHRDRRGEGHPGARRHAAVAGRRDARRRDDRADPAQHDDPDQQEGDLLHGRGQPAVGDDQRAAGRARVRHATTACWAGST